MVDQHLDRFVCGSDTYSNRNADKYTYANADKYTDGNADADKYTDGNTDQHSDGNADAYSDGDAPTYVRRQSLDYSNGIDKFRGRRAATYLFNGRHVKPHTYVRPALSCSQI
jgi:hypothetical protein